MKKLLRILLCLCVSIALGNAAWAQQEDPPEQEVAVEVEEETDDPPDEDGQSDDEEGYACQLPPGVTNISLSHQLAALYCQDADEDCGGKVVEVSVTAVDTGENVYVYKVSGGKIIGEGPNVKWDLSDAEPGVYTITAGIVIPEREGIRLEVSGQTKAKTVTLKACRECP